MPQGLQEIEDPLDIAVQKRLRPGNRSIHMSLSGKVDYGIGILDQAGNELLIGNVSPAKFVSLFIIKIPQVFRI